MPRIRPKQWSSPLTCQPTRAACYALVTACVLSSSTTKPFGYCRCFAPRRALSHAPCHPCACHDAAALTLPLAGGARQGDEKYEPYCEWIGPDTLQANVLSSSSIKGGDVVKIKPGAIHPQGWPSEAWACDEVDPPVCARPLVASISSCDDPRTTAREPCRKPSADVIMSLSALTARPPGQTRGNASERWPLRILSAGSGPLYCCHPLA